MKTLLLLLFTLTLNAQAVMNNCNSLGIMDLARAYQGLTPTAAPTTPQTDANGNPIQQATHDVNGGELATIASSYESACKECIDKGYYFNSDNRGNPCDCSHGVENSGQCTACQAGTQAYVSTSGTKSCQTTYFATMVPINEDDCSKYGMSFTAKADDNPAKCGGSPVRSVATSSTTNPDGTTTTTSSISPKSQLILNDLNKTDDEKKAACESNEGYKWKRGSCEEKGGLFGGGGGGGLDLDFDSVTSVAGEALGNETVQNALLGAASGMGIGMVTSKFFSQTCEDEIKDDKCFDAAIELKKNEALRGHCEENKAKAKCKDHFFANDRGFFKTNWCDDEENVMDADMKTKCFNISKDSYFETHCTEEKMGNLKTPECFEMKTANPKKFFEIYCSEGSAVQALPEFKSAGADRECAVMKKNPSINEDYDPDEESDDEDEDHDEDEDMDEDDSDDVAEYDSDDEGDNSDDDSEDMDDDEIADSDSDSDDYSDDEEDDGDLFADSDTGRAIASMEHSSVSQDLSASSDDKIMQLANMGHFNGDPALCEGSIYQVDSNCSMRKHANYLIKGKLGRVKIVGQKTLVCVYENHTGARFSAVIKKDCQL